MPGSKPEHLFENDIQISMTVKIEQLVFAGERITFRRLTPDSLECLRKREDYPVEVFRTR